MTLAHDMYGKKKRGSAVLNEASVKPQHGSNTVPGQDGKPLLGRALRRIMPAVGTAALLALCTWMLVWIREVTEENRPYTIFYLIPVAVGAGLLGVRAGMVSALGALVLARIYLFNDNKVGTQLFLSLPSTPEEIEFFALLAGTATIAVMTGRLRSALSQLRLSGDRVNHANARLAHSNAQLAEANDRLEQAYHRLQETEEQQRTFHRDVLQAVTGGKLRLVEPEDMPPSDLASGKPLMALPLIVAEDATHLRQVAAAAQPRNRP